MQIINVQIKGVKSISDHGAVYSIQFYAIHMPVKADHSYITEILLTGVKCP